MSAVRPGRGGDGGQDWPGDVELDLLLLSAHASGLSALREVIDTEQGLAAILTRQQTGERPGPQRPGGEQLSSPAASRSPPPPPGPDSVIGNQRIITQGETMNVTRRIRTTALAGIVALAALIGGTAAAVVAAPAPHISGGGAVAIAPGTQYEGLQPATHFQG